MILEKRNKMSAHNKKRNAGLLYEFLIKEISTSLVEGDKKRSNTALKILKTYFKPGTELYKEFRLINSLIKTHVSSQSVVQSILSEAKRAAEKYDLQKLDREKSLLIKTINHTFGVNNTIFDHNVNEYKKYATVQTLINDWRSPDHDIFRIAKFEDQLTGWLLENPEQCTDVVIENSETPGTNRLVMKILSNKLNEKYDKVLNSSQKDLIRVYAIATTNQDEGLIREKLQQSRETLLSEMKNYISEQRSMKDGSTYVADKLEKLSQQIVEENIDAIDDDTITKYLSYMKLYEEIIKPEENV